MTAICNNPPDESDLSTTTLWRIGFRNYLGLEALAASAIEYKNPDKQSQRESCEQALMNFHRRAYPKPISDTPYTS